MAGQKDNLTRFEFRARGDLSKFIWLLKLLGFSHSKVTGSWFRPAKSSNDLDWVNLAGTTIDEAMSNGLKFIFRDNETGLEEKV